MCKRALTIIFLFGIVNMITGVRLLAQPKLEFLGRGLVALRDSNRVFLSWRYLVTDVHGLGFNIYRCNGPGKPVLLNRKPIVESTNFIDTLNDANPCSYVVKEVEKGIERSKSTIVGVSSASEAIPYLKIPLHYISGYSPNDASVGDLDGDGEYEIIVHQTGRSFDNSADGVTDPPIFQAYKLDGSFMWSINLGKNIREGAHYTQFIVYDLDGDGRAEFCCKTADGSIDGRGKAIGDKNASYINERGKVMEGPEYLTVFDGLTGAERHTVKYVPSRYPTDGWGGRGGSGGNDNKGNRVDRFLAAVAYLDGVHPSLLMCRGYYGRTVIAAWDFNDNRLTQRWVFDSDSGDNPFSGQGNHNLSIADIDGDGKDEIIYGAMTIDDNGLGLYSTGFGHGDALHVGDLDPATPGLEIFGIHEIKNTSDRPGVALLKAATGDVLWSGMIGRDVGRGVAENITETNEGAEMWFSGSGGVLDLRGRRIGESPSAANFLIWWDGDLTREILNSNYIEKYGKGKIFEAVGAKANNGTKCTPALCADIIGDWREELLLRSADDRELRIYVSKEPTVHRLVTLMHDPQYRVSVAWQNVGYNQPAHLSFFMGEGRKPAGPPPVQVIYPEKKRTVKSMPDKKL